MLADEDKCNINLYSLSMQVFGKNKNIEKEEDEEVVEKTSN